MLLASTVLAPPMALAAVADAGAAADPAQVSEVIVTAEKRSENIQTVPVSIEALDNRTLGRHAVND
jgi:iron complex outermembrane receptor protein